MGSSKGSESEETPSQSNLIFTKDYIEGLEQIGIRVVGIYLPSNAAGLSWKNAYPDLEFRWSTTKMEIKQDRYSFAHAATMLGRTYHRDPETGEYYNLNALDIDSQLVYNRLSISIEQLLSDWNLNWVTERLRGLVKAFLSSVGVVNGDYKQNLLKIFKKSTFVTKTRKIYGHHIYWLSVQQKKPIGTADCKKDREFEIKTDNSLGLCTLPRSAHKNDSNFRYKAVGITDHIIANDVLYDLFVEMLKDCIDTRRQEQTKEQTPNGIKTDTKAAANTKNFVVLSSATVTTTAGVLSPFVSKDYRNEFYLRFCGMMFHSRISEVSGAEIVATMCAITNDEESRSRQATLTATYKKGFCGGEIEGAPKLAELIANKVKDHDIISATALLDSVKSLWRADKRSTQQRQEHTLVIKSVSEAKRMQAGYVKTRGTIMGMSTSYHMFKKADLTCEACGYHDETNYDVPQYRPHIKRRCKCPAWNKGHVTGDTAIVEYEYIPTVDIWAQDMDRFNDLDRLQVKLFDNNTFDVNTGEVVDVVGHIHVDRDNDSLNSKPEAVLFADELVYTNRNEITVTKQDIEDIIRWKKESEIQGKNVIDELAAMLVPEVLGMEIVKKGLLNMMASAGLKNEDGKFPERQRVHVLLIGDPGTAKSSLKKIY